MGTKLAKTNQKIHLKPIQQINVDYWIKSQMVCLFLGGGVGGIHQWWEEEEETKLKRMIIDQVIYVFDII